MDWLVQLTQSVLHKPPRCFMLLKNLFFPSQKKQDLQVLDTFAENLDSIISWVQISIGKRKPNQYTLKYIGCVVKKWIVEY